MKDLHELTDLQLAIMQEVWRRDRATVTDVHEALVDSTGLAKKTVGTMMTRLEKQGFLSHSAEGREFVYEPLVSRNEVEGAKVQNVLDRLFGGSLSSLVSHALESRDVERGDVERVRHMLDEWTRSKKSTGTKRGTSR